MYDGGDFLEMSGITKERLQIFEGSLGVFEETSKLRQTVMWGPAGIEAAIAQLLPVDMSCFQTQFDVLKARSEFSQILELMQNESPETKVLLVRDEYARQITASGLGSQLDREQTLNLFKSKAKNYYEEYGNRGIKLEQVNSWIDTIFEEDEKKYGLNTALILNQVLVNGEGLPLANSIYARDQSNVIGDVWIWSSMRHTIRQPEVAMYKEVLGKMCVATPEKFNIVAVNGGGKFEGGDAIVSNGIAYIGVGGRTNIEGVGQIAPSLLANGLRVIAVYDKARDQHIDGEMDTMHLDTFAMPVDQNTMVLCKDEAERRIVFEYTMDDGVLVKSELGGFVDFLVESGVGMIEISKEDQIHFAPNFVNLGERRIVLSLNNVDLAQQLTAKGYTVLTADMSEITKGYGGLHCSMAPIERGN